MSPVEPTGPEERAIERVLEEGLARSPLTDDAYARIQAAVAAEWRLGSVSRPERSGGNPEKRRRQPERSEGNPAKRQRRDVGRDAGRPVRHRWLPIAAGLAAATLLGAVLLYASGRPSTLGVVAQEGERAFVLHTWLVPNHPLTVHSQLRVGDVVIATDPVLVDLRHGGILRIAGGSRLEVTAADEVSLDEGEVYLDFPPDLHRASAFVVGTPLGLVEHLGTQFDVALANELRIRVREGSVRLRRGSQTETAGAGTELVVPRVGQATRRSIATHGPEWSWVEALEPDFPIEDRKLSDFLQWAARETGRQVHFLDEHAREVAERTLLHGSIHGLSVTQALETVFATTSLRYNLEQGRIEVSSGG